MLSSILRMIAGFSLRALSGRGDQCVGYLMVTLPTPQRASQRMGARETPSPRGDYALLMCSRSSELGIVRYRTQLPSCGRNDRNQRRKRSESGNSLVGGASRAFHLNDIRSFACGGCRRSFSEKARRDRPTVPVIGNDCYGLFVVSDYHSLNNPLTLPLKPNPFADLEPQHLDMSPQFPDHAEPLDNLLVEMNQF